MTGSAHRCATTTTGVSQPSGVQPVRRGNGRGALSDYRGGTRMKTVRAIAIMFLLLSGCGSCQRSDEASSTSGAAAGSAKSGAVQAPAATAGKIQVAPLQATPAARAAAPQAAAAGGQAAAPPAPPAEAEPGEAEPGDDTDCIVVADADPDYGPPPLAVTFSAEAECSAGQPAFKWNFGDDSPVSTETNPSHTYTKPGDYTATVTVTASSGATASDEIDITVEEGEAEAQ